MSVIGRMDKQVDEVLISPLARKKTQNQDGQMREETIAPHEPDSSEREQAPVQNRRAQQDALPVWLL